MHADDEYARRLDDRRRAADRADRVDRRLADVRLGLFAAAVGLGVARYLGAISSSWLLAPAAGFVALVILHARARARLDRARAARRYYERALDRLAGRWAGLGDPGADFLDESHPYAADLDICGVGSLYERLCRARTPRGRARLAAWLLAPAGPSAVAERQGAVEELRGRLDLREDLGLIGTDVGSESGGDLAAWGAGPGVDLPGWGLPAAAVLAAANLVGLGLWLGLGDVRPLVASGLTAAALAWHLKPRVAAALGGLDRRADELRLVGSLLGRLEGEPLGSAGLVALWSRFAGPDRAVPAIAGLAGLARRLENRRNQLVLPFAALMLAGTRAAYAVERWRHAHGAAIGGWLDAVGEVEALSSLATYAFENPGEVFPEVVEGPASFEARGLAHPLLGSSAVANDVCLVDPPRALVISGSNMSGKSTLLRSVGVAAVLSQAGGVVRAVSLRMSPLAVGANLKLQDSLQAGRSRFYAEITRVRQVVDIARGPVPLLFLLDEVFSGTNSHDRRIGAEGVVRGLLKAGAIGLVTTHDLALAELAANLAPAAANVHFADHLEGGEMIFDYTMRPGVIRHSNALALMRAVGLEV